MLTEIFWNSGWSGERLVTGILEALLGPSGAHAWEPSLTGRWRGGVRVSSQLLSWWQMKGRGWGAHSPFDPSHSWLEGPPSAWPSCPKHLADFSRARSECNLQGGCRGQGHLMGLPWVRGSMVCRAPGPYEVLTEGERAWWLLWSTCLGERGAEALTGGRIAQDVWSQLLLQGWAHQSCIITLEDPLTIETKQ